MYSIKKKASELLNVQIHFVEHENQRKNDLRNQRCNLLNHMNGCGKQYIGEAQSPRQRVTLHDEQIKHPQYRHLYVSKHISRCAYDKRIKYKICPIFKLKGQNSTFRQVKEI